MKTPTDWEDWCDDVWTARRTYPTWHELVTAIQEDACGISQSKNGTSIVESLLAGVTSPDYGEGASRLRGQSPLPQTALSFGDAHATAEDSPTSQVGTCCQETAAHADALTENEGEA